MTISATDEAAFEAIRPLSEKASAGLWHTAYRGGERNTVRAAGVNVALTGLAPKAEFRREQEEADAAFIVACANYVRARLTSRSSQRPSPSVGREEVARIIDPEIWDDASRIVWKAFLHGIAWPWQYSSQQRLDASLAKADAILALAQPATGAVEGEWVTVPREPTEAMLKAANKASLSTAVLMDDTRFACERATYTAAIAAAPKPTLPAGEWTDEQVEAAAFAARSTRHRLYAETPAKHGSAHSKEQMDGIEIAAFRAALATITPTAGGRPTTTKEK